MNTIMAHLMFYVVIICIVGLRKTTNILYDSRSTELYFSTNKKGVMAHTNRFGVTGLHKQSQIADCRAVMNSRTVSVITLPHVVSLTFMYDGGGGGGEGIA